MIPNNGAERVMEYWDTQGVICATNDAQEEYNTYINTYEDESGPLTLQDFEDYLQYIRDCDDLQRHFSY